jgi:hypothetical protein
MALLSQNLTTATDAYNVAVGHNAGQQVTTGVRNTIIGGLAGDALTTGHGNVIVGESSGGALTTGTDNTMVGPKSGQLITTGSDNTIIGNFSGNQGGLDIRTSSGHIVLSDGDGNVRSFWDNAGNMYMHTSGSGIYIGGASSANKLDDYEEGTFTPTAFGATSAGTTTHVSQIGYYTKIGRLVTVNLIVQWSAMTGTGNLRFGGLPFTIANKTQHYPIGSCLHSGLNLTGGVALKCLGIINSTTLSFYGEQDDAGASEQQCVNESANIRVTITYETS